MKGKNFWIVKPGEYSNRGKGISVCSNLQEIKSELSIVMITKKGNRRTYILQQYIDRPFLFKKRKFDIRCFMMLTSINGRFKGIIY